MGLRPGNGEAIREALRAAPNRHVLERTSPLLLFSCCKLKCVLESATQFGNTKVRGPPTAKVVQI